MNIFVFGSNLAGRHGAGSAREAVLKYGAQYGIGEGRTGNAYAIPTKDEILRVLPLSVIGEAVARFLRYARANPCDTFYVVEIGCGLAGYTPEQIAPLFRDLPANVWLPTRFKQCLTTS